MKVPPPRADLSLVARNGTARTLLQRSAVLHGSTVVLAGPDGRVLARYGGEGEEVPESVPAFDDAWKVLPVEVYDHGCGIVAARGGAAAEAASFAADLVATFATGQYETDSLSRSLLASFEEVNLFYGITARLHSVSSVDGICQTILERACEVVRADRASIMMADPHSGVLRVVASRGMSPEQAAAIRVPPGVGISGRVMRNGQAILVDDARSLDGGGRKADDRYASRSFISVPLRVFHPDEYAGASPPSRQQPLGVLNMTDKAEGGPFTSGDLKLLSALSSQAAVLLDNTRLAGIEKEMVLARNIQASLLPQAPPTVEGTELAGICIPARNVGGDYYDLFALPGGRAGILVADVSGHNVGAALMMAVSRAALRAEISRAEHPEEVLARVNRLLDQDLARSELFVSVFLAFYDPRTGILEYASAGHNPGVLARAGGGGTEDLDAEGILFGVMDDFPFERSSVTLEAGDCVVLYTDGFTEAREDGGAMFGEERFRALVAGAAGLPTAAIPAALVEGVDAFTNSAPSDDRTLAVLRACTMGGRG